MNKLSDPINTVDDFNELMLSESIFENDSFEYQNVLNSSGSDKENGLLTLTSDDGYVSQMTSSQTRSQKRVQTRSQERVKTRSEKSRSHPGNQTKAKQLKTIVIGSDSEDDNCDFSGGRERLQEQHSKKTSCTSREVVCLDSDDDNNDISEKVNSVKDYLLEAELHNSEVNIKIKWTLEGGICYKLRRFQPFRFIYLAIAKEKKIDVKYILLSKEDGTKISHSDTPESINLSVVDILITTAPISRVVPEDDLSEKARIVGAKHSEAVSFSNVVKVNSQVDIDVLSFTILTECKRNNKRTFTVKRNQCMYILFVKIAEQLECEASDVTLWFDGEKIQPEKTSDDQGLEGGECLELKCKSKSTVNWTQ